jgi:hypothetical protein
MYVPQNKDRLCMRWCNYYIKSFYSIPFQTILANISNNISIVISLSKSQWEYSIWKKLKVKLIVHT